jgi:hypothetical protein
MTVSGKEWLKNLDEQHIVEETLTLPIMDSNRNFDDLDLGERDYGK